MSMVDEHDRFQDRDEVAGGARGLIASAGRWCEAIWPEGVRGTGVRQMVRDQGPFQGYRRPDILRNDQGRR